MAYTAVNVQTISDAAANPTETNGVAGGDGTGHSVNITGQEKFLIRNNGAGTPNFVIEANATRKGKAIGGDLTVALAASGSAGALKVFKLDPEVFADANGLIKIHYTGTNETDVRLSVFK